MPCLQTKQLNRTRNLNTSKPNHDTWRCTWRRTRQCCVRAATLTILRHLPAFLLYYSRSITSLTHRSTSPLHHAVDVSPLRRVRTPTRQMSATYLAFIAWSDHRGMATIGRPTLMASVVEFHPQCVTKQPTAECASTFSCGLHDVHAATTRRRQLDGEVVGRRSWPPRRHAPPRGTACRWRGGPRPPRPSAPGWRWPRCRTRKTTKRASGRRRSRPWWLGTTREGRSRTTCRPGCGCRGTSGASLMGSFTVPANAWSYAMLTAHSSIRNVTRAPRGGTSRTPRRAPASRTPPRRGVAQRAWPTRRSSVAPGRPTHRWPRRSQRDHSRQRWRRGGLAPATAPMVPLVITLAVQLQLVVAMPMASPTYIGQEAQAGGS